MNVKQRQQMLLLLAGLAVVLLLGDRLVLTPLVAVWKDRAARMDELRASLAQGELLMQREDAIRSRWSSMKDNTLPGTPSAAENELLKAFERWSRESGISIASIQPQWREGDEEYLSLECRAEGFGGMEAVSRFLYEVENDPMPVKVDGVEITARDAQGQVLTLGLQVSGLVLKANLQSQP